MLQHLSFIISSLSVQWIQLTDITAQYVGQCTDTTNTTCSSRITRQSAVHCYMPLCAFFSYKVSCVKTVRHWVAYLSVQKWKDRMTNDEVTLRTGQQENIFRGRTRCWTDNIIRMENLCIAQQGKHCTSGIEDGWRRGVVVECRTCDPEVAGSSLSWAPRRKTLSKFLTPVCLCHQAV